MKKVFNISIETGLLHLIIAVVFILISNSHNSIGMYIGGANLHISAEESRNVAITLVAVGVFNVALWIKKTEVFKWPVVKK